MNEERDDELREKLPPDHPARFDPLVDLDRLGEKRPDPLPGHPKYRYDDAGFLIGLPKKLDRVFKRWHNLLPAADHKGRLTLRWQRRDTPKLVFELHELTPALREDTLFIKPRRPRSDKKPK